MLDGYEVARDEVRRRTFDDVPAWWRAAPAASSSSRMIFGVALFVRLLVQVELDQGRSRFSRSRFLSAPRRCSRLLRMTVSFCASGPTDVSNRDVCSYPILMDTTESRNADLVASLRTLGID